MTLELEQARRAAARLRRSDGPAWAGGTVFRTSGASIREESMAAEIVSRLFFRALAKVAARLGVYFSVWTIPRG